MKKYLVPALLLTLETPILAADGPGFNDLHLVLMIAANLLIGGLILFGCLVLGAALVDQRRQKKLAMTRFRIERPERERQPRPLHRNQKMSGARPMTALGR